MQLRFIGFAGFVLLAIVLLFIRKLSQRMALSLVLGVPGALIALLVAGWLLLKRRMFAPDSEDRDLDLAPADVEVRLLAGSLSPTDLIHEDGMWITLLDSSQFGDAAERRAGRLARRAKATLALTVALVTTGLVLGFTNCSAMLNWLVSD